MRIIIKPFGALLLLCMLLGLVALVLRSNQKAMVQTTLSPVPSASKEVSPATIYNGTLQNGWENYSWAKGLELAETRHAPPGQTACIRAIPEGYQAVYFHHSPLLPTGYDRLTFAVHGGETGGQVISFHVLFPEIRSGSATATEKAATVAPGKMAENATYGMTLSPLPARRWRTVTVRLADFGIRGQQKMIGFWLQNAGPNKIPEFFVSDVRFLAPGEPEPTSQ